MAKKKKLANRSKAKQTAAAKRKKKKFAPGGVGVKKQPKKVGTRTSKKVPSSKPAVRQATSTQNCLDLPEAIKLVRNCAQVSDDLPLDTQLGQIFPSASRRNNFCQCVADGVPKDRSEIHCGASNTLQDVVDDIAC